jgi:aminoglycoside phosphotransferase (APT) family kinase protein
MTSQQQTYPHQDKIDWRLLEQLIKEKIDGIDRSEELIVKPFSAGYSNLTFAISIGDWSGVLRRPPFGELPPKAHDMEREYRVLSKINSVFPLAPRPYLFSEDKEIMERPFYVMERKFGVVIDDHLPEEFASSCNSGKRISEAVVDNLAILHQINYEQAGLVELGKPDGYLKRQVEGWISRYNRSQTDEISVVKEVETYLLNHIPNQYPYTSIVHNDFKLNNLMFEQNDPGKIIGVFDWEMATIGDPLSDLASSLTVWKPKGEPYTGVNSVTELDGFINRREFIERYAAKTGFDVTSIEYYISFGFYKLAAILQQIYYRWKKGALADDRFDDLNVGIKNLMYLSYQAMRKEIV